MVFVSEILKHTDASNVDILHPQVLQEVEWMDHELASTAAAARSAVIDAIEKVCCPLRSGQDAYLCRLSRLILRVSGSYPPLDVGGVAMGYALHPLLRQLLAGW